MYIFTITKYLQIFILNVSVNSTFEYRVKTVLSAPSTLRMVRVIDFQKQK